MKFVRFEIGQNAYSGSVSGDSIVYVEESGIRNVVKVDAVKILPPVAPSKIVAVGLNYKDHAEELKMEVPQSPVIFIKPASSVIGHNDTILYPESSSRVDYEAELAVVIGKTAKNVSRQNYKDYISGYTCFNDVTARDLQKIDGQWTRAKSFDTFSPVGPYIEDDIDISDLSIKSFVNGRVCQDSSTKNMIFKVPELIEFITGIMTLFPGDIIATGTPPNVGPVKRGDVVAIEIEGIGRLINNIA